MKLEDVPKFEKFDLAELYFKNQLLGKGHESAVFYLILTGYEKNFGDFLEVCENVAREFAVRPQQIILNSLDRVLVYKRQQ